MKVKVKATNETWTVWSDNTDERTYSCLPEGTEMDYDSLFVWDLKEFPYDEVEPQNF